MLISPKTNLQLTSGLINQKIPDVISYRTEEITLLFLEDIKCTNRVITN